MPIDTRDWYREKNGYKSPPSHKSYRPPRRKLPPGKIFLILLIVACVVATIYTGYLLFTHRTNWGVGAIVLAADIGVLIWNISVLRKYRVGTGTVISILVVIALLGATVSAFAGVEPFSDAKAEVVAWFQEVGSQTPTPQSPPASKYPADIIGHVTITETVKAKYPSGPHKGETMEMTPLEGQIFWIADISVKNKFYEDAVTASSSHWKILVDDKGYEVPRPFTGIQSAYPLSVPMGETGKTTIRFSVPDTLKVSSAKLCYQGQEPYSYGKLTSGDKVAVYDWDLKRAVEGTEGAGQTAVAEDWLFTLHGQHWKKDGTLIVKLTITNLNGRRDFGFLGNFDLVAIDSTNKIVEPWVPTRTPKEMAKEMAEKGILFYIPPYSKEFYPNESWTGELKFEMSPYSGETKLYMRTPYRFRRHFLFDLGSPTKD